jgi:DNA mismatch repair protein MutL
MPAAAQITPPSLAPAPQTAARPLASPAGLFPPAVGGAQTPQASGAGATVAPAPAEAGVPRALQVLDCYLVVEVPPDEVLFIDQHALHERILFEKLQARLRTGTLETQRLLIPEPVHFPATQAALVLEHRGALSELGLTVEGFGGGTVILSGYPALLGKRAPKGILRAVADHLVSRERAPSRELLVNDLLSLMACHAAVRAGDMLTQEEIAALLSQRELARDSHHCPHGRPTSVRFGRHDLEKMFKRV